ncbi:MAG: hypothetical protein J0H68_01300 [Sphingobacteriia bacterium]|nr:hypothetical protein [Sphingobacteriia bacterium]
MKTQTHPTLLNNDRKAFNGYLNNNQEKMLSKFFEFIIASYIQLLSLINLFINYIHKADSLKFTFKKQNSESEVSIPNWCLRILPSRTIEKNAVSLIINGSSLSEQNEVILFQYLKNCRNLEKIKVDIFNEKTAVNVLNLLTLNNKIKEVTLTFQNSQTLKTFFKNIKNNNEVIKNRILKIKLSDLKENKFETLKEIVKKNKSLFKENDIKIGLSSEHTPWIEFFSDSIISKNVNKIIEEYEDFYIISNLEKEDKAITNKRLIKNTSKIDIEHQNKLNLLDKILTQQVEDIKAWYSLAMEVNRLKNPLISEFRKALASVNQSKKWILLKNFIKNTNLIYFKNENYDFSTAIYASFQSYVNANMSNSDLISICNSLIYIKNKFPQLNPGEGSVDSHLVAFFENFDSNIVNLVKDLRTSLSLSKCAPNQTLLLSPILKGTNVQDCNEISKPVFEYGELPSEIFKNIFRCLVESPSINSNKVSRT